MQLSAIHTTTFFTTATIFLTVFDMSNDFLPDSFRKIFALSCVVCKDLEYVCMHSASAQTVLPDIATRLLREIVIKDITLNHVQSSMRIGSRAKINVCQDISSITSHTLSQRTDSDRQFITFPFAVSLLYLSPIKFHTTLNSYSG